MDVAVEALATISITGWAYRVTAPYRFERTVEQVRTRLAEGEVLVELTAGAVCRSNLPVARGATRIVGIDPLDRAADASALPFTEVRAANSRTWAETIADSERPDVVLEMAQDYLLENPWFARYFVTDVFGPLEVEDAFLAACQPKPGQRKVVIDFRKP